MLNGTFYELVPDEIRKQGPWQGMHRGEIDKLKPEGIEPNRPHIVHPSDMGPLVSSTAQLEVKARCDRVEIYLSTAGELRARGV